jgi:hypothetical protein
MRARLALGIAFPAGLDLGPKLLDPILKLGIADLVTVFGGESGRLLLIFVSAVDRKRFPFLRRYGQGAIDAGSVAPVANIDVLAAIDEGKGLISAAGAVAVIVDLVALSFVGDDVGKVLRRLGLDVPVALNVRSVAVESGLLSDLSAFSNSCFASCVNCRAASSSGRTACIRLMMSAIRVREAVMVSTLRIGLASFVRVGGDRSDSPIAASTRARNERTVASISDSILLLIIAIERGATKRRSGRECDGFNSPMRSAGTSI